MKRTIEQYAKCDPYQVVGGSHAQALIFAQDAKSDIAELAATTNRLRKALETSRDVHAGLADFILNRPDKAKSGLTKEQVKGVFADLQRARLAADAALEAKA